MSIEVKHLSHIYAEGTPFESAAVKDVSFTIEEGSFTAIIGHTGSGKSTLIAHLNGLNKPTGGDVLVDGLSLTDKNTVMTDIRKKVGLVFQYPEYQLFEETVEKDIAFGPVNLGLSAEEAAERVAEAARLTGIDASLLKSSPFELSGGQKRRVAIAGVIALKPRYLILDEPAAGLDPAGHDGMLQLMRDIRAAGATVIMVTHSMDDVVRMADRVLVMNRGELFADGTPGQVFRRGSGIESIGLGMPGAAVLRDRLIDAGFDAPEDAVTYDALTPCILKGRVNK